MITLQERDNWEFDLSKINVLDNFFTPECLDILKIRMLYGKYCDDNYGDYQAVDHSKEQDYMTDTIASELKSKINLPQFQRGWSFIYNNESDGVGLHCDPSVVNINIWVSSDKAVKDTTKNGLDIYEITPPKEWSRSEWNSNPQLVKDYIESNKTQPIKIDYKSNRAVMFPGDYFHTSNGVSMKEGFENRRVSYTLLFGATLDGKLDE